MNGIVITTSIRVGGDEMDEAIVQYMKKAYNMLIGEQTAERIKIEIGSAFPPAKSRSMEIKGRDLVARDPEDPAGLLGRDPRGLAGAGQRDRRRGARSLERTPPELAADIVDRGIVMTGGGALLRGLDLLLREHTNLR